GEGEGHARLFSARIDQLARAKAVLTSTAPTPVDLLRKRLLLGSEAAISGCDPRRVLVLLAGAGAELVLIDQLTGGEADITGVEMIPEIAKWPKEQPEFGLREFYSGARHHQVIAEAREFLGRDRGRYDCIMISWPGAGRSYQSGIVAE